MMIKSSNIYYFNTIQKIGGIETFFYQLAKKYSDYDFTIIYRNADENQLRRLKKYVRCVKFVGQKIICDKAFFNFNTDIIDNVEAKEYCLVVHGDYKMLNGKPPQHPKINKYYGVSQTACDSFTELTGKPCELVYNPLNVEKPKRLLRLCSACRLDDAVKGGKRTQALVEKLDKYCEEHDCNYIWNIFTNNVNHIKSKNIAYMEPRLDINNYLADADYVVQLSDNFEGFNYTINEALLDNTPLVITPCNVYKELGIDETMAIMLDFDLSNTDQVIEEMFNKVGTFKFDYNPPKDNWGEIFVKSKSIYKEELKMRYKVEALDTYKILDIMDAELNRVPEQGEQFEVSHERLEVLLGDNTYNKAFVKMIEKVQEKDFKTSETSIHKEEKQENVDKSTKSKKQVSKNTTKTKK